MEFWLNPAIDMQSVKDSMELKSGQDIATLSDGTHTVSLEIKGDISIHWTPDEETDEIFTDPSEFPLELMDMIRAGSYIFDPRVHVYSNNWYEVFYWNGESWDVATTVVEVDGCGPEEICAVLADLWNQKFGEKAA